MNELRLKNQDFAKNAKVKMHVKVTYLVQEEHEAIVAIDESLDGDEIYEAVVRNINEINWKCPDKCLTSDVIDDHSVEIDEYQNLDETELNNRYFLLKKVNGKFVGGVVTSDEV